jgi:hypothetical protein
VPHGVEHRWHTRRPAATQRSSTPHSRSRALSRCAAGNYTLLLATQCSYRAPLACGTERVRDVIQVIRATYTPAAARFTLGTLAADLRAQLPVPAVRRETGVPGVVT